MRFAYIGIFLSLWALFSFTAAPSAYWRDGGEFVLSAFYLDISHPAGFPTYASLANLFALLPLGPIAWRVHLFSSFSAALVVVTALWIAARILQIFGGLGRGSALLISLPLIVLLLGSIAFLHQTGTAEVYVLNTLFFEGLLALYIEFLRTKREGAPDIRYLYLAAFLSGLGLGNHASLSGPLAIALPLLFIDRRAWSHRFLPCLAFGLLGLCVYVLPPARAGQPLPLRTANPGSLRHIFYLLTDGRDRALKGEGSSPGSSSVERPAPFESLLRDLQKLEREVSPASLCFAAGGLLVLFFLEPRLSALFLGSSAALWGFFRGWQPYPWLPIIVSSAILAVVCLGFLAKTMRLFHRPLLCGVFTAAVLLLSIVDLPGRDQLHFLHALRDYVVPASYARELLSPLDRSSVYVTESSWFQVAYLRYIERWRSDLTVVYQPRILFPEYFEPTGLSFLDERKTRTSNEADFDALGALIQRAAAAGAPFAYEPSIVINSYLAHVTSFSSKGVARVVRDEALPADEPYVEGFLDGQKRCIDDIRSGERSFGEDTQASLEASAGNVADLLLQAGAPALALLVQEGICRQITPISCSPLALRNIAVLRVLKAK